MSSPLCAPVLVIRQTCCEDAGSMLPLMRQLRYPTTPNVLKERISTIESEPNRSCSLVAELDGHVMGTVFLTQHQTHDMVMPVTHITALVVDEQYRGRGIGRRLLLEAEMWSKQRGSSHLMVSSVDENNKSAKSFYTHLGFNNVGYRLIKTMI